MGDDNESLRMLVLLIVIGLLALGMTVATEPAPTHLCPRDYFDAYGRCP